MTDLLSSSPPKCITEWTTIPSFPQALFFHAMPQQGLNPSYSSCGPLVSLFPHPVCEFLSTSAFLCKRL